MFGDLRVGKLPIRRSGPSDPYGTNGSLFFTDPWMVDLSIFFDAFHGGRSI